MIGSYPENTDGEVFVQEEDVAPSVYLLESMRAVGYSFPAALADLIDNSITAGARRVDIDVDVVDGAFVTVLDDGHGMAPDVAREALRLSGSPRKRTKDDLGRFGLGLKTASLSQGRVVTVATRSAGVTAVRRWDIDHVLESGRWSLLELDEAESQALPSWKAFDQQAQGTLVVWQYLDLLLGDANDRREHLSELTVDAGKALSLVFHRFLRGGGGDLAVTINGARLEPIDPFLESNTKTQFSKPEAVNIAGHHVEFTIFTLPHPSGMKPAERARHDLAAGMRDAQGFYVYRNRRLISHGSWFGLASKSEITKQTRVRVDIPNTLDQLWQLDIKKSRAEPPASFKNHLRRVLGPFLERGKRVHTFRGRQVHQGDLTHVWNKRDHGGNRVTYEVNSEHPLVLTLSASLDDPQRQHLEQLLGLIAQSFPANDLYAHMASSGLPSSEQADSESALDQLRLLRSAGVIGSDVNEAVAQLGLIEPFNQLENLRDLVVLIVKEDNHGAD
jgi:Histidine kinase-, DNA gyrase B-, and HSP90-like ATPase